MSVQLNLEAQYAFEVDASFDKVFDLLSDIPRVSCLHPALDRIVDLGAGNYRWEMKKIGTERFNFQTLYTCNYAIDRHGGNIIWKPIAGEGNALVEGSFKVTRIQKGTQVNAQINSIVTLPVPAITKKLVDQFISNESRKLNEKYIATLIKECGNGQIIYIKG